MLDSRGPAGLAAAATAVAALKEASDKAAVAAEAARAFCSCPAGSVRCWAWIRSLLTVLLAAFVPFVDLVEERLLSKYGLLSDWVLEQKSSFALEEIPKLDDLLQLAPIECDEERLE